MADALLEDGLHRLYKRVRAENRQGNETRTAQRTQGNIRTLHTGGAAQLKALVIVSALVVIDGGMDGYLRIIPFSLIITCYLLATLDIILLPRLVLKVRRAIHG
jgi:hypothetical protein